MPEWVAQLYSLLQFHLFVTGLIYKYILANEYLLSKGIDLTYLQTIVFILVIAKISTVCRDVLKRNPCQLYTRAWVCIYH